METKIVYVQDDEEDYKIIDAHNIQGYFDVVDQTTTPGGTLFILRIYEGSEEEAE